MCVVILRPLGKEDQGTIWCFCKKIALFTISHQSLEDICEDESQGWTGAKAMMSDVGFMRALQEYKKDRGVLTFQRM